MPRALPHLQFTPARRYRCRESSRWMAAGTLHIAGYGGLVSTLSTAQGGGSRIFGIANAAFGPVGGRVAAGEVISIYGPQLGPSTPVTAVPDASGMMPRSLGGVQVSVNGSPVPLLYVSEYADQRGDAGFPFGRYGARAREFQRRGYCRLRGRRGGRKSRDFPTLRWHGGGRQSGWQHQFAGASGGTGKHRCDLGHGDRSNAFRRVAGRPDSDGARQTSVVARSWREKVQRMCCTEA